MFVERRFRISPLTEEMLTRVQRYANLSPDEALALLVKHGFVAYRLIMTDKFGIDPAAGSPLDLPDAPREDHQPE